jgi:uncharacterized membrane protein YhiD involved in acid resistance
MNELIKNFLETNINQALTLERIVQTFAVSLLMGLLILLVYRLTYHGVLYNKTFGSALVMVGMVTTLIIMPISSNIVLSLGMVGALSIVRFRTALKDPLDIVYMFWAIAVGLTSGAGFFALAILGSIILALVMFMLSGMQALGRRRAYLLIIRYTDAFQGNLHQFLPHYKIKSKTVNAQGVELVVELMLPSQDTRFLDKLQQLDGIISASLVRYSSDF